MTAPWVRSWSTHCIHECFEAKAHQEPAAIALCGDEGQTSFQELNRRANCLAQRLIRLGVGPDQLVAIYLERSFDLITSLLGVLKAGGAYVGLELNAPAPQLQCILDDARPTVVITSRRLARDIPPSNAAFLFPEEVDWQKEVAQPAADVDPRSGAGPMDLAYVSFTSGSTGRPKGVCIRHRGVVRLAADSRHLHVSADEVFLQLSPISFDASTFEIWASLLNGASLAVYPSNRALSDLGEIIREHGVTTLWLTSGLFNSVVDANLEALRPIRRLFAGGDVLSVAHVRKAFAALPDCRIINGYGPTENTTFTCCYQVAALPPEDRPLPIGTPLDHNEVYVLDDQLRPVPAGAVGELVAGGDGLARGYLNLPDLTAKAFPPHPFASDLQSRVYRTGDLVRQLPGGELEFVGRIDGQVKIRGYRVEPEAVEAALVRHPAVRDAAVVTQSRGGRKHLIAFVCHHRAIEPAHPDSEELRRFLRAAIPPYMIPSDILFLDELPLTPTGKVDRHALSQTAGVETPAPDAKGATSESEAATPDAQGAGASLTPTASASAAALARIWQKVLGRSRILPEQDLWELAPDSVQVLDLLLHVRREFGRTLSAETLLTAPTVAALADVLDRGLDNRSGSIIPLQPTGTRPPLFWIHGEGGDLSSYAVTARHLGPDRPVLGLAASDYSSLLKEYGSITIENLAARHVRAIKKARSSGPYHLCGFCFGGLVAYEVARQLVAEGHVVGLLAVLDFAFDAAEPFRFRWGTAPMLSLLRNMGYWIAEFVELSPSRRREVLTTTLRTTAWRIAAMLGPAAARKMTPKHCQPPQTGAELAIAHAQAWPRYVPKSYSGVVTLFRPRRLTLSHPYDPLLGWGPVDCGGLNVEIVSGPGVHGWMLRMPDAPALARRLEACMKQSEAQLGGGASNLASGPPRVSPSRKGTRRK